MSSQDIFILSPFHGTIIYMDNFAYLDQITQSTKPQSKPKSFNGILSGSNIMKIIACGIVVFMLLLGFNILSSNSSKKTQTLREQIFTRATNLNSTLQTYGPKLKSSQLRSINSSLSSALNDSIAKIDNYNKAKQSEQKGKKKKSKSKKDKEDEVAKEEQENIDKLNTSLQNAKLNGLLDRVYANQINLQVSRLIALISELDARTRDQELREILEQLYSNLNVIHGNFENFVDISS